MVALSKLYTFERRKYVSPFRSAALEEESDPRINDVVLSTGNINQKYIVRDIVFVVECLEADLFDPSFPKDDLFLTTKRKLKTKVLEYGANAVINRLKVFSGTFCLWNSDPIYPNNDWLNETDKKSGSKLKTVSIRFFLSKLVTTSSYTLIRMISSKIYLV